MARVDKLELLRPGIKARAEQVLEACGRQGVDLLIYCTLRTCQEQARLYRQSRTLNEIRIKADSLEARGLGFLAGVLMDCGPVPGQLGQHVTHAAPGESSHQYGEAWDAVPLVDGKPDWSGTSKAWEVYGLACEGASMEWAGRWVRFRELPHAQGMAGGNPLRDWGLSPVDLEAILRESGSL